VQKDWGSETWVLSVVSVQIMVFWDMFVGKYCHLTGTYCLLLQGQQWNWRGHLPQKHWYILQISTSSHSSSTQSGLCSACRSYQSSYQCNDKGVLLRNCNFLTSYQSPSNNIPWQEKRELFQRMSCCHQDVCKTKAKWDSNCQGQYECLPHCWPEKPWNNKIKG